MITDGVRLAIAEYLGIADLTEEMVKSLVSNFEITPFDGGAFISKGPELDIFVEKGRRAKWRIRSICSEFLKRKHEKYDILTCKIRHDNLASLRLVKHFGFKEYRSSDGLIELRKTKWVD